MTKLDEQLERLFKTYFNYQVMGRATRESEYGVVYDTFGFGYDSEEIPESIRNGALIGAVMAWVLDRAKDVVDPVIVWRVRPTLERYLDDKPNMERLRFRAHLLSREQFEKGSLTEAVHSS